jgi:hypothetical protein
VNVIPILLALSVAGLEQQKPPAAPPAPEIGEPRDWSQPPAGASAQDRALWKALDESHAASVTAMARVAQASYRLRYGRYYESLDEKKAGPQADGAKKARARIESAARAADDAIPKQGLRIRVCKYTLLHFDQRLAFPEDPGFAAELPKYRAEAKSCVDELSAFAKKLTPMADAFEASLADADTFLGRASPAVPASAPQESGARPPGAR